LPTNAALDIYRFECLIDRQGISGGEDWKRRLGSLISEADTVVSVLSSASTHSESAPGRWRRRRDLRSASFQFYPGPLGLPASEEEAEARSSAQREQLAA
jgi:hypothetical protein